MAAQKERPEPLTTVEVDRRVCDLLAAWSAARRLAETDLPGLGWIRKLYCG